MPSDRIIWGPPGTGKTQAGITLVRHWTGQGVDPSEIAYLAYTKAAAKAAAMKIFETEDETRMAQQYPYFRTLHSLCYRALKSNNPDIRLITTSDMKAFSERTSFEGKYSVHPWEDLADVLSSMRDRGRTEWDLALSSYHLSRIKAMSIADLEKARREPCDEGLMIMGRENMQFDIYSSFVEKYEAFKQEEGLIDFTDMLEYGLRAMPPLDDVRFVVLDECVPAGTMISMADGSKKPIEKIGLGEKVLGVDHHTGEMAEAKVVETRSKETEELVIVDGELCLTPNHPIFIVGRGYVPACNLKPGDQIIEAGKIEAGKNVRTMHADVLLLPIDLSKENLLFEGMLQEAKKSKAIRGGGLQEVRTDEANAEAQQGISQVLQRRLRVDVVQNGSGINSQTSGCTKRFEHGLASFPMRSLWNKETSYWNTISGRKAFLQFEVRGESEVYGGRQEETFKPFEASQSDVDSGSEGKGEAFSSENLSSAAIPRRQRHGSDKASGTPSREIGRWLAARGCDGHKWCPGVEVGEAGHREFEGKNCGGMRRGIPQHYTSKDNRSTEGSCSSKDGMGDLEVLEQRNSERNRQGCKVRVVRSVEKVRLAVRVFNIGTSTENYFAEGVLVHNCQDLAPIHHGIVDRLFTHAEEIWWAGDDDQSIFLFNGASADLFLKRAEGAQHQIQLRQTHRFGQQIVDFSGQIIQRVSNRHPKEIIGVEGRQGKINLIGGFEPITGDVLILHRHVQGCVNIAQAYMDAGLPFRNERGKDPLEYANRIKAWQAIEYLSKGETVPATQAAMIIEDLLPTKIVSGDTTAIRLITHGGKSKLDEKLKGAVRLYDLVEGKILTPEGAQVIKDKDYSVMKYASDLEYYERLSKNGYEVDAVDNIPKITTIHGSKGRQAERVVVFSEMGNRCWDDFDTEHRLAYVAATRTKTDLTICLDDKVAWAKSDYDYPVDNEEKIEISP